MQRGALWALLALLIFTAFYTTLAGLWGVLVTDLVQFVLKMGMVVALAYLRGARRRRPRRARESQVRALDAAAGAGSRLAFFPSTRLGVDAGDHPVRLPRRELVGELVSRRRARRRRLRRAADLLRQRPNAHGLFATLWFNIAHYAVRPWPWILTALASLVLYPTLVDKESGYVRTLMDPAVFPAGAARHHAGGVRGRVHVDDRHPAQLGRVVCRQRLLPAVPATATEANASMSSCRRRSPLR